MKTILRCFSILFIFFLLQSILNAQNCSPAGLIQYKPDGKCDTLENTCCRVTGTWSGWTGTCPACECSTGGTRKCGGGNGTQSCGSNCVWGSCLCDNGYIMESGICKPMECTPGSSESSSDYGNTYYGCTCYKNRTCGNDYKWTGWVSSADNLSFCGYNKINMSKSDCAWAYYGGSEYDLDRYCGYGNCVNDYIKSYFDNGGYDPNTSCEGESLGPQVYWYDSYSGSCYGYTTYRVVVEPYEKCASICQSNMNNY